MNEAKDKSYCDHCGKDCGDIFTSKTIKFRYATMPNTLTNLKDINNPAWQCPHCGYWSNDQENNQ